MSNFEDNPQLNLDIQARLLLHYLNSKHGEMIAFLRDLVNIESPSTNPEAQATIVRLLADTLLELDLQVHLIHGVNTGDHLVARFKESSSSESKQLLLGHCDTVWPIGTLIARPFTIDGGIAKGPGIFDMKAGLTQMVFALKALRDLNLIPSVYPIIFVNSDEEIGSVESSVYIREVARNVERVFVLEPALGPIGRLKTRRKGVGSFKLEVQGQAAHAGLDPDKGVSAILAMSFIIQDLFALNDLEKGISVNVGTIEGGLRPNVIAPTSSALIDVRALTKEDADQITQRILAIRSMIPGARIAINGGFTRQPLEQTPANVKLWSLAASLGSHIGLSLEQGIAGGGSDGNLTSQFTATLDGLGAVGDGAHADHEFVEVDKLAERTALLAMLIMSPSLSSNSIGTNI